MWGLGSIHAIASIGIADQVVTGQQKGEQQAGTKDAVTTEDQCTSEKERAVMHTTAVGSKEKEVVAIRCPRQTEYNQGWGCSAHGNI
jgi:hypothetical protein